MSGRPWRKSCLDESTVSKYVQFGVNVLGISPEKAVQGGAIDGFRT